jgi:chromosome segregation ATPase
MREKLAGEYTTQLNDLERSLNDQRIQQTELEVESSKRVKAAQDAATIELKEAHGRARAILTSRDDIQEQVRQHEARHLKSQALLTHLQDIIDDCESRLTHVSAERDDAVSELRNAEQSLENADTQRQQLDEFHQQVVAMQGEQRIHDEKVNALSQQNESELTEIKDQLASEIDARQSFQAEAEALQVRTVSVFVSAALKLLILSEFSRLAFPH